MFIYVVLRNESNNHGNIQWDPFLSPSPILSQQVSDILVHPDFHLGADSNVAVLKLRDKAKISERVLPVCLPKGPRGEAPAWEGYSVRWISPHRHGDLSRSAPISQTKRVEVGEVVQCEREIAQGGEQNTAISNNTLCAISEPSGLQRLCSSLAPGFTAVPVLSSSTSVVLSGHDEGETSAAIWQLVGLEAFSFQAGNCNRIYVAPAQIASFRDWIVKNIN